MDIEREVWFSRPLFRLVSPYQRKLALSKPKNEFSLLDLGKKGFKSNKNWNSEQVNQTLLSLMQRDKAKYKRGIQTCPTAL
jgi:hypothetical protein